MMKSFAARLATWRPNRTSLRELSRLSDRELDDLGIGRADIQAVASGAPVMTSEEIDATVTCRLGAPARSGDRMPNPSFAARRPAILAA